MTPALPLRAAAAACLVLLPSLALAQDYDPVAPVAGGVCGLINFQFCPQPPGPAIPLPDPEGDAEHALRPPPPVVADDMPRPPAHHRARHHRHIRHAAE